MPPRLKEALRPLRAAARLGFQIESNWSDPIVFVVYALAKPLATSLILYVMFRVIVGAGTDDPRFIALYQQGKLPVDRMMSQRIGFDQLNEGFDRLQDVATVRQVLVPHG